MADDIYLSLRSVNNGVQVQDMITGSTSVSSEIIVVNGRIAKKSPEIVGQAGNGVFYTPVLVNNANNRSELLGTTNGVFFKSDGKTPVTLRSYANVEDRRYINLPTLISNADDQQPIFYSMIAHGENALKLASAPIGSSLHVVGELKDCWVGKFSIKVLRVISMTLRRKAGPNESLQS